jgi:hypothetical protein
MYIELQKHHCQFIIPIIEARMKVLKNRILKGNKEDWYDYEPEQIEMKICMKNEEYNRLNESLQSFYQTQNKKWQP